MWGGGGCTPQSAAADVPSQEGIKGSSLRARIGFTHDRSRVLPPLHAIVPHPFLLPRLAFSVPGETDPPRRIRGASG